MSAYYTGIGSRKTPHSILEKMEEIAWFLHMNGDWILRSGHAQGADQAFESGAKEYAQVFLPWRGFESGVPIAASEVYDEPTPEAHGVASEFHPMWAGLKHSVRRLHARNAHQVLGPNLDDSSSFVVCWTENGREVGGTSQALRIARKSDIRIFNLGNPQDYQLIIDWLRRAKKGYK